MFFLKYIGRRNIAEDFVSTAENLGIKRAPRDDKAVAKQHK